MRTLGTLVGDEPAALKKLLKHIVDGYTPYLRLLGHELMSVQVALLIIRHSIIPSFNYLSRIVPLPSSNPMPCNSTLVFCDASQVSLVSPPPFRMWHSKL